LLAEFQLTDTQEIKHWVKSLGPNPKVLEPELVIEIQRDLNNMLAHNRSSENLDREKKQEKQTRPPEPRKKRV